MHYTEVSIYSVKAQNRVYVQNSINHKKTKGKTITPNFYVRKQATKEQKASNRHSKNAKKKSFIQKNSLNQAFNMFFVKKDLHNSKLMLYFADQFKRI